MTYCENCGSFIKDFQDRCDNCGRETDRSYEHEETQMFWLFPLTSWEDSPRYSAVNSRRLKDADLAFCMSSLVPGLGHAYDGMRDRGALVFVVLSFCWT